MRVASRLNPLGLIKGCHGLSTTPHNKVSVIEGNVIPAGFWPGSSSIFEKEPWIPAKSLPE
jgi:hypothetical protein